MKKVALVVSKYLQKNCIFDSEVHRDNIFDRFILLKQRFAHYGYNLSTDDINSISESEIVIYASNMPKTLPSMDDIYKSYLILSESQFIRPDNYDLDKHRYFKKVFTWRDDLIDNKKYFKLNYAHLFPEKINKNLDNKIKLCVLIAGNKRSKYFKDLDLYGEREKAIRWFEKNQPENFDLYGVGWDKYCFTGSKVVRAFNRVPWFSFLYMKLTNQGYSSYKGKVDNKNTTMQKYKFSICYENARNIPGYITEKIFDSFFSGCVPVYWGANNVSEHIPIECYIDMQKFSCYGDLYTYLDNMPDDQYLNYLNNIEKFLKSKDSMPFRSEGFVDCLVKEILLEKGNHDNS